MESANAKNTRNVWAWAGWEPDRHYRRAGRRNPLFFGNGEWVSAWRQRLSSEENIIELAESGVTHLVSDFFKGFGIQAESHEWERVAALVATCHRHGLKVLGYTQSQSLCYETLLVENPAAENWFARHEDGSIRNWGGAYYRPAPCLGNPEFLGYLQEVCRVGIQEIGLDGLHFDNSYFTHCYCETCQAAFRAHLSERCDLDAICGIEDPSHVKAPPAVELGQPFYDPLNLLWSDFEIMTRFRFFENLTTSVRRLRSDVILVGNPAFPRHLATPSRLHLDLTREGSLFDVLFSENANLPGWHDGGIQTQDEAYLFAQAGGWEVLATAWNRSPERGLSAPNSVGQIWCGLAEEFSHRAAWLGTNWLLRPSGDGARILGDDLPLRQAFETAVQTFQSIESELDPRRQLWSESAILWNPRNGYLVGSASATALRMVLDWHRRRNVPARILFSGQSIPPEIKAVWLCEQAHLTDQDSHQLNAFTDEGGHVLAIGECDCWNDFGVPRDSGNVRERTRRFLKIGPPLLDTADSSSASDKHMGSTRVTCPDDLLRRIDTPVDQSVGPWTLPITAPDTVAVKFERESNGRLIVHCCNYDPSNPGSVIIHENGDSWRIEKALQVSIEGGAESLLISDDTEVNLSFDYYAMVTLLPALEPSSAPKKEQAPALAGV